MLSKAGLCLVWGTLLLVSGSALAQEGEFPDKHLILRVSPQHLLLKGYHLEVEKGLKQEGAHSLLFSPRVYAGSTRFADSFTIRKDQPEDYGRVKGWGTEIQHRIYARDAGPLKGQIFYLGYGVNFHHFNIKFENENWAEERNEDGLLYYEFKRRPNQEKIDRWGAVLYLGRQETFVMDRLLLDLYLAIGYNHSSTTSTHPPARFNRNMMDYGHTGYLFYPGFKIGLLL